jgi:hypothetical protein
MNTFFFASGILSSGTVQLFSQAFSLVQRVDPNFCSSVLIQSSTLPYITSFMSVPNQEIMEANASHPPILNQV